MKNSKKSKKFHMASTCVTEKLEMLICDLIPGLFMISKREEFSALDWIDDQNREFLCKVYLYMLFGFFASKITGP